MRPQKQINGSRLHHPAKVSARHVLAAGRGSGLTHDEIRKLMAGGKLGRALPADEMLQITKGIQLGRWARLNRAMDQCDRKLKAKGLPDETFVALQKAKAEYLAALSVLTKELEDAAKVSASHTNGQPAAHAFGPREQIGNMTAVQVNIGKAPEKAPETDVNRESIRV